MNSFDECGLELGLRLNSLTYGLDFRFYHHFEIFRARWFHPHIWRILWIIFIKRSSFSDICIVFSVFRRIRESFCSNFVVNGPFRPIRIFIYSRFTSFIFCWRHRLTSTSSLRCLVDAIWSDLCWYVIHFPFVYVTWFIVWRDPLFASWQVSRIRCAASYF